jgi:hypothetical protein
MCVTIQEGLEVMYMRVTIQEGFSVSVIDFASVSTIS